MKSMDGAAVVAAWGALAVGGVAVAQDAVQWRVEDGGNGHWYAVHQDSTTGPGGVCWSEALSRSRAVGGDLLSLTSPEENQFVLDSLATFENCGCYPLLGWIGIVGDGTWSDGTVVGWTNWGGGQPSGDGPHATMAFPNFDGMWNDIGGADGCHSSACCPLNRWIVEWSADCDGDGIVDYGQILDGTFEDANENGVPDCCEDATGCDSPTQPVRWPVEVGGNGHWYQTYVYSGCISENIAFATARGADLLCVSNGGEWNFIKSTFQPLPPGGFCLGALGPALTGAGWQWSTGEPWTFQAWAGNCGKPDNGANGSQARAVGCFDPANMEWDDLAGACIGQPTLILEWSADCNSDGIVDYGQILDGTFEDANGNGVPDCCDEGVSCDPCPGDVNNDGQVNGADISVLLGFWGLNGKPVAADINKDGQVDGTDLANVLGSWGECP